MDGFKPIWLWPSQAAHQLQSWSKPSQCMPDRTASEACRVDSRCAWVKGEAGHDIVGQAHFRQITHFTASELQEAVPEGESCVIISVKGASFMARHTELFAQA